MTVQLLGMDCKYNLNEYTGRDGSSFCMYGREFFMKKFLQEFKDFAIKGNMLDLAIGMIIGAAFSALVSAMVADLFNPVLSLIVRGDFQNLFIPLDGGTYKTLAEAQEAGAAVFAYGDFITQVINFILQAFVIFLLVKVVAKLRKPAEAPAAPAVKTCPYCKSEIAKDATKCPHCTSQVD